MKDDFLACLTREIKDEVMERYVTERRIMELQIESLQEKAREARAIAGEAARRLARLADSIFDQYRGDARRLMELWEKGGY